MEPIKDKILGSWFGMALGEAMGLSVRGLKPETVSQCFKQMDGFKDVRPFIGKGVKRFSLQGLYGAQTQLALSACEVLLMNRKMVREDFLGYLIRLTSEGPEPYLGLLRHPQGRFRRILNAFPDLPLGILPGKNFSDCSFISLAVPVALYHPKDPAAMRKQVLEAFLAIDRNLNEAAAIVMTGYCIQKFLDLQETEDGLDVDGKNLVLEVAEFCEQTETFFKEEYGQLWEDNAIEFPLSHSFRRLIECWNLSFEEFKMRICEQASPWLPSPVNHISQGLALTLIPLALRLALKEEKKFSSLLTRALNMGRAADSLGTLVGALAGALYGFSSIPDAWRTGLMNAKEIKIRGEALFSRRYPKGAKDLVEMESGLTQKEYESGKKYIPKIPVKAAKKPRAFFDPWEDDPEEPDFPPREDAAARRKFLKDKTRKNRNRRRNIP